MPAPPAALTGVKPAIPRDLASASALRVSPSLITTEVTVAPLTASSASPALADHIDDVVADIVSDEREQLLLRFLDQQDRLVTLHHLGTGDHTTCVDPNQDPELGLPE